MRGMKEKSGPHALPKTSPRRFFLDDPFLVLAGASLVESNDQCAVRSRA